MLFEEGVFEIVGCERDVGRTFDDGFIWSKKIDSAVFQITTSELTARNCYFTVCAISEKNRSFDRTNEKLGPMASINSNLCRMIQQYHSTILQVFYHESITINITRFLD